MTKNSNSTKKPFSWRAFISFALFFSFFIIFITGIVLYIAPPGRVAHWVNWKLMGLTKGEWQSVHTIFSIAFIIFSLFHLFSINWKAFISYIRSHTSKKMNKKRELIISSLLTLIIFMGTIYSAAPFSSIMNWGEELSASWEEKNHEAPIPHAERLTLIQLSNQLEQLDISTVENNLKQNKLTYSTPHQTVGQIATLNKISPDQLYKIITQKASSHNKGMRLGRKTLDKFASENNKDVDDMINILKERGIDAKRTSTFKSISVNNDISVRKIYELIK